MRHNSATPFPNVKCMYVKHNYVLNLFTYMRHTLQKHWAQFDKCWITSINCRHLFSFTSIHIHGFPCLRRWFHSSNILKYFTSWRSEDSSLRSTCMDKMQGGWVGGVGGVLLNKRPTMATCCTIIIAKARVKRYLVVKKLSPAIIQHSCQPARDTEVKKVPIIKNKKVFNCQSEKMPP